MDYSPPPPVPMANLQPGINQDQQPLPPPPPQMFWDCPMTNLQSDPIQDPLPPPMPDIISDFSSDFSHQHQHQQQQQHLQQQQQQQHIQHIQHVQQALPPHQPAQQQPPQQPPQSYDINEVMKDFLNMLADNDPVIVMKTANVLFDWSKADSGRLAISQSPDMIKTLVLISLSDCTDEDTIYYVSGVLNSLSLCPQGQEAITMGGGVPCLIKMLNSTFESIVIHALTAIHNLLVYCSCDAASKVKAHNGLLHIVALLEHSTLSGMHKFLAVVTDCMYRLAFRDPHSQQVILENRGPYLLLETLKNNHAHDNSEANYLMERTSATLKVMASGIEGHFDKLIQNKRAIIEAGGMQILSNCLSYPNPNVLKACLWTLRNLSDNDAAINQPGLQPLLSTLVFLLSSDESTVVAYSLATENMNGIKSLVETIKKWHSDLEVTESAICTLRHLTRIGDYVEYARQEVCQNGLDVIESLIDFNNRDGWTNKKGVLFKALMQLLSCLMEDNSPMYAQRISIMLDEMRWRLPDPGLQS